MTDTIISSATKEVVIGFDRPFVIIGERINPTGRKILAAEMAAGDYTRVISDALAQVEAGAHMLDVNAGIPLADEPAILAEAVKIVQSITDVPLSIDSSIVAALESGHLAGAALDVFEGEPLASDHPLWGMPNVIVTPHTAGVGAHPEDRRYEILLENVRRFVSGAALHNVVDKHAGF